MFVHKLYSPEITKIMHTLQITNLKNKKNKQIPPPRLSNSFIKSSSILMLFFSDSKPQHWHYLHYPLLLPTFLADFLLENFVIFIFNHKTKKNDYLFT